MTETEQTEQGTTLKILVPVSPANLSFAERKAQMARASETRLVQGDGILRDITRTLPGDPGAGSKKPQTKPEVTKQRSQYFEDVFSTRGATNPAKERIRSEAIVMAELKTNVIVADEFGLITDLSSHLSLRYKRPLSSVVVVVKHGACMCFGGSFEPAYVLSVFALPSELQPTTNRRNAALIQKHLEESMGVPPSRGFLRFVPVAEENSAHNGKTVAGQIEDVGKDMGSGTISQSLGSQRSKGRKKAKSFGTLRDQHLKEPTPPASSGEETPPVPPLPLIPQEAPQKTVPVQEKKARRTKSFVATIFRRSTLRGSDQSPVSK